MDVFESELHDQWPCRCVSVASTCDLESRISGRSRCTVYISKIDSIVIIDSPSQIFVRFSRDGDPEAIDCCHSTEARPGSRLDACFYLPFTRHSGMAPGSVNTFSSRELPRLPTLVRWFFSISLFLPSSAVPDRGYTRGLGELLSRWPNLTASCHGPPGTWYLPQGGVETPLVFPWGIAATLYIRPVRDVSALRV